jgi:hypothetical protein
MEIPHDGRGAQWCCSEKRLNPEFRAQLKLNHSYMSDAELDAYSTFCIRVNLTREEAELLSDAIAWKDSYRWIRLDLETGEPVS